MYALIYRSSFLPLRALSYCYSFSLFSQSTWLQFGITTPNKKRLSTRPVMKYRFPLHDLFSTRSTSLSCSSLLRFFVFTSRLEVFFFPTFVVDFNSFLL